MSATVISYPFREVGKRAWSGDLARPQLPMPNCRVKLVCGPVAAGKSTFVKMHAVPSDLVIDLDLIAREYGYGRNRPHDALPMLLIERNDRLAALSKEHPERLCWFIVGGASAKLREWWCNALGISTDDVVLLIPAREELFRRIRNDPDRRYVRELHVKLVNQWFERERTNDAGRIVPGIGRDGYPNDPLHPWNSKIDEGDIDPDIIDSMRNNDPDQSKNSNWQRNIEIYRLRRDGLTVDELCELYQLSDQRIKSIVSAVAAKIREGKVK